MTGDHAIYLMKKFKDESMNDKTDETKKSKQLVGYITACCDHEYVIVSQYSGHKFDADKTASNGLQPDERKIIIDDPGVYSAAVYCHKHGLPAFIRGIADDMTYPDCPRYLKAVSVKPVVIDENLTRDKIEVIKEAVAGLSESVYHMNHETRTIVESFLLAFTQYKRFDEGFKNASNLIQRLQHEIDDVNKILFE